ncbi:MAG: sugar transferase [Pseudomonadota bacterium]
MKRIFDVFVACGLLALCTPVMLLIAIAVRIAMGSPVLLRQMRPGLGGRPFAFIKFRSMTNARDASGELLPDELRITRFGAWLRRSSLDELPQLFNVLRGDISIVGPRPLLMEYLPLYNDEQRRRHDVRPGITGWAQVNGRNAISWEEKFKLDVWYVDNQSFWLDLKILFLTLKKVLKREGINAEGHVTVEKFRGSSS